MAESLHHLDLLLQLQAESFQETLEAHVSGFWSIIFLYFQLPITTTRFFSSFQRFCFICFSLHYSFYLGMASQQHQAHGGIDATLQL